MEKKKEFMCDCYRFPEVTNVDEVRFLTCNSLALVGLQCSDKVPLDIAWQL